LIDAATLRVACSVFPLSVVFMAAYARSFIEQCNDLIANGLTKSDVFFNDERQVQLVLDAAIMQYLPDNRDIAAHRRFTWQKLRITRSLSLSTIQQKFSTSSCVDDGCQTGRQKVSKLSQNSTPPVVGRTSSRSFSGLFDCNSG